MPDQARTRSELVALLADNTTGDISEQDVRDLLKSIAVSTTGSGPPTIPAGRTGDRYFDLTNDQEYIAVAAGSSPTDEDWRLYTPYGNDLCALVRLTTDESISATTNTQIPWDSAVYDYGGWWDSGQSTRLTVPAGVTKVIANAGVAAFGGNGRWHVLSITKNGTENYEPVPQIKTELGNDATIGTGLTTGIVDVAEGDYFELRIYSEIASTVRSWNTTYLGVRAIEYG